MPRGASQTRGSKEPATEKKKEEKETKPGCVNCPVAKAFGLCEDMCSVLGNIDINEFFMHMANARKEIMLGLRSLLDEAIRIEDEKGGKRQAASGKNSRTQKQLREISIE